MAGAPTRKISPASARAHTRKTKQGFSFPNSSGILKKLLLVSSIGFLAWAYQAIQAPPPKIPGSEGGPLITAPRIKLRDGRNLAYKEHGVSKEKAKFRIIYIHGFDSCRNNAIIANTLSQELIDHLGVYIVSFDRPGYGESDPNPKQTAKSNALDIEELADQLSLGTKFYVVGFSMGGQIVWNCLYYIPKRLAGAALISPAINYWWSGFPANLSRQAFNQKLQQDQWALRVAHYTPWLTYLWNTQKWFPSFSILAGNKDVLSPSDREIVAKESHSKGGEIRQQGELESVHRDLMTVFGTWEFNPLDIKNPFPNSQGSSSSVHIWQGDEDRLVPATLQRFIAQKLDWIQYHEIPGAGHLFPLADGMSEAILRALLLGEATAN